MVVEEIYQIFADISPNVKKDLPTISILYIILIPLGGHSLLKVSTSKSIKVKEKWLLYYCKKNLQSLLRYTYNAYVSAKYFRTYVCIHLVFGY